MRVGDRPTRPFGDGERGGVSELSQEGELLLFPARGCKRESPSQRTRWALGGIIALALVLRFASLDLQSYHHDEVITAMRVIPGGFAEMLHAVKWSESNPPFYYVLAWGWAKVFGIGEFELRSLSALFGAATAPVGYLIGRQLVSRRAGLILAALIAVNPMLIWYSQEARSYALLVFFGALSLLFFARALDSRGRIDLGAWALASVLALWSHYFAVFAVGAEAVLLLILLRHRRPIVLAAIAATAAAALPLLPLIGAQLNPTHIDWIHQSPLPTRLWETVVSSSIGETGHVIAAQPRVHLAWMPLLLGSLALVFLAAFAGLRERRAAGLGLALALSITATAALAAVLGHDYITERNLLPALIPLLLALAAGFAVNDHYRLGLLAAVALCAYWTTFAFHVTQTPNLQRPDFQAAAERIERPASAGRAIVTWRLADDPIRFYLDDRPQLVLGGDVRVREVDLIRKPLAKGRPSVLPPSFRQQERIRLNRLTVVRYVSPHPVDLSFETLRSLPTGFGTNAVLLEGARTIAGA